MNVRVIGIFILLAGCPIASVVSAQSPAWQFDRPCQAALPRGAFVTSTVLPAQSDTNCKQKTCARLPQGGIVCQCLTDSSRTLSVDSVGPEPLRFVRRWSDVYPDSFEVVQADLEGDGSKEIVLAIADAVSNGIGIPYWTVIVMSPGKYGWIIDSLHVEEYSSHGSWVAVPHEKRCNLLLTNWVNGLDPVRGSGLYLEASWQTLEFGKFEQRMDRPVLSRRFLFSFDRERQDTTIQNTPWAWLRSKAKPLR